MKRHIIIGTAGHIDHGKTALIKALTDIDTDVLKEEKERGITIELGFAYWKDNITIIDVPGHERFVKTMVAGVSTVDLFLLVIAADDGIMPQTREHLDILKFFGVKNGLVALNKIDLVDDEWRELILLEIEEFLRANGYDNTPIIPVSAVTGQGVDELRNILTQKIEQCAERASTRPFRLNVDRSFSVHGSGTVVTGTVLSDAISVDDNVVILPEGRLSKIRGIQVHQKDVTSALVGQRAAINLSNVSREEVERGKTLTRPNTLEPVREFLAVLHTSSQIPMKIKKHQEVRVYLGTAEILGRIAWFEENPSLEAEQTYHVRIRLEEAGVCAPGDAVLIRTTSPFFTIAGGRVLFLNPPPMGRMRHRWQEIFKTLRNGQLKERIKIFFEYQGFSAVNLSNLATQFFEKKETLESALTALIKENFLLSIEQQNEKHFVAIPALDEAQDRLLSAIHSRLTNSSKALNGFNKSELKSMLKPPCANDLFFDRLLQRMVNRKALVAIDDLYLTPELANMEARQKQAAKALEVICDAGFQALTFQQIAEALSLAPDALKPLLSNLVKQGKIHSLAGSYYLHDEFLQKILAYLKKSFAEKRELDIASFKNFTGLTRKVLIPLLEYLDQKQFTIRQGDVRIKGPMLN
ncbi:selenocysteine-specific translation elongation factor [Caldithrix abyssi DSM 13497]|uniref:Selenocysteine-specific elongation factor n=1 Tax=Caldithrix abyssi DSM 13497 TaxID=880073 RepID=H1XVK7_CALAY|nr:selenocysteine-specific translation elongation factor [Caldithrix abyssi]APF18948.1 selenocysteine-specific translation elongation factor SelB [Caldithrix abyssi DSM 13497]EHO42907.1 selenocysteine-specific translation elongation factor [Caldithrix abyssi DSM 13497]